MTDERLFIVAYDISDQRRWRRVFKAMHGYGEWIQLSVFQCRLSRRRRAELERLDQSRRSLDVQRGALDSTGAHQRQDADAQSGRLDVGDGRAQLVVGPALVIDRSHVRVP